MTLPIRKVWIQTSAPSQDGSDPGAVAQGFYTVDADLLLTMTNERGEPVGKTAQLKSGDDAHLIAQRLTREIWTARNKDSAFHRPLRWPSAKWVV